jgi:hypothetical protein
MVGGAPGASALRTSRLSPPIDSRLTRRGLLAPAVSRQAGAGARRARGIESFSLQERDFSLFLVIVEDAPILLGRDARGCVSLPWLPRATPRAQAWAHASSLSPPDAFWWWTRTMAIALRTRSGREASGLGISETNTIPGWTSADFDSRTGKAQSSLAGCASS